MLLAGADRLPPPDFLLVVVLDAIAAGGIVYRAPHYLQWQLARRPRRLLRVMGDGVAKRVQACRLANASEARL